MIYVETVIHTDVARVWRHTRNPALHARWDVRFTRIDGLTEAPGGPVRFRYRTTVLPGVHIDGIGVTAGERERPDGTAVSVLHFGSADRRSLIEQGDGYWRYVPVPGGVRFLTGYDYAPRWGRWGRLADRAFRPLFGWATAWSFDRLRLWLEHGISPAASRRLWLAEAAARVALVTVAWWLGPVPLLLAIAVPPGPRTPAARRCRRRPATKGRTA
ncbi:hypothetical protein DFJ67_0116 [Asanoa ferruginea]|uniref:Polyketide cyclase/dehydrase/lipid transport protein n=1 Tax=Asanoa ferruginea TaxID=53367 RepID=A0A3D9ZA34_9ACTN|nr:hypothetical protein [Asanoa ferruginea]REF94201.1 hypothetical protein DFJ67_0116 [Asanoa ferruginea]GIF49851.1 hypothetical protein Afe04nite_43900 [Asanoa ferruginea]